MKVVWLAIFWGLLITPGLAQESDFKPLSGDGLKVFLSPWVQASLKQFDSNGPTPPLETVDFTLCEEAMVSSKRMPSNYDLEGKGQAFAARVPHAAKAMGDYHVHEDGRRFLGFTAPGSLLVALAEYVRVNIIRDILAKQYPNGAILILIESQEDYREVNGNYQPVPKDNTVQYSVLRLITETDGEKYFQLIQGVTPQGQMLETSKVFYSCLRPDELSESSQQ